MDHRSTEQLTAGLPYVRTAPRDVGALQMIVRRPAIDVRELLDEGELDTTVGLVGDTWQFRPSTRTPDGSPHPDMQLTLVNTRFLEVLAGPLDRWPLAGDQLYVDFDIGVDSLPAGSLLTIGTAVVEITAQPHTGCAKFTQRFGLDGMHFVNSDEGKALRLRGANAKVVEGGTIRVGDPVTRTSVSRANLQPTTTRSAGSAQTTPVR